MENKEIKKILRQRLEEWEKKMIEVDSKDFGEVSEFELEQRLIADHRGHEILWVAKALDIDLYEKD